MFFQAEVKCLEDKNIDFKYTQCKFFPDLPTWVFLSQIRKPIHKKVSPYQQLLFCKAITQGWSLNKLRNDNFLERVCFQMESNHSQKKCPNRKSNPRFLVRTLRIITHIPNADTNFPSEKNSQLLTMIFSENFLFVEIFLKWKWALNHQKWKMFFLSGNLGLWVKISVKNANKYGKITKLSFVTVL
jgi:hypothetical protein